jgi:glycolate oxidase iron-sulfur subunit
MTALTKTSDRLNLTPLLEENTEKLLTCVHCGLCLPACPTYRQLGNENDSPRGRVYLMRGVVEGTLELGDAFISHIDLCLGCRGCETVCPSGVPYGHLLEAARADIAEEKSKRRSLEALLTKFVLNNFFTRPWLLRFGFAIARTLRNSGLLDIVLSSEMIHGRIRLALALLLATRSPLDNSEKQTEKPGGATTVAILKGCVMEGLFRETNRATERVLSRNGCELADASNQVCCGALHSHAGQIESARRLAKANIEAFNASGADRIIVNAAGCGAAMKEYGDLLADDPQFAAKAREFSSKVRDVSEFLVETGITAPTGRIEKRVAYDAPCHLIHAQKIALAPIELLRTIPGLEIVPLRGSESCCGGAGIYNLQHPELSSDILGDKISSIRESNAEIVVTANPGCIMQIGAGALINNLNVEVVHPIELLDAAYED